MCANYAIHMLLSFIKAMIITGMTRILNNRHWIIDVIVGAALGILLTEMAYRLVKTIFKDRELINTDYNH